MFVQNVGIHLKHHTVLQPRRPQCDNRRLNSKTILSRVLVTVDRVLIGEYLFTIIIDHFQVVTTNNYYTIADFHTINHTTLSSKSAFTSRCLVTALHNGCSSAKFTLNVSK
jgi:hypothetical protein